MEPEKTKEQLRKRIETLESENGQLRKRLDDQSNDERRLTRRTLIRASAIASVGALSLGAATGTVAAEPTGTFPAAGSDPLLLTRVDHIRFITRTNSPATPDTGRVAIYVDEDDLP